MDYFWMMGDNRHRSQDSRYWGFVPEDHIVGKASLLIASIGDYDGFRWNRVFKSIHGTWAPKDKKFTE
jgi:signal peptidase I